MFRDNQGNLSSMRLLSGLVVVAVLGNWTYINYITQTLQPLNLPEVIAMIGSLGAKAIQKGSE